MLQLELEDAKKEIERINGENSQIQFRVVQEDGDKITLMSSVLVSFFYWR